MNYFTFQKYVWTILIMSDFGVEISVQCYKVIYKDLNYADNL